MRKVSVKDPFADLLRMRSPKKVDLIFDMVCAGNYFAGQFGNPIPVDKNREVLEHIKKLLIRSK
jgi:hypothetical protein